MKITHDETMIILDNMLVRLTGGAEDVNSTIAKLGISNWRNDHLYSALKNAVLVIADNRLSKIEKQFLTSN